MKREELNEFFNLLVEDCMAGAQYWADTGSEYAKRSYVRAAFSFIEGHNHRMKKICLLAHKNNKVAFEQSEVDFLNESGKYTKISVEENIKKTFKLFSKAFGITYSLNTGSESWSNFKSSLKVRHRLMHPKSPFEFTVTDLEMLNIEKAILFYRESTIEIVEAKHSNQTDFF